MFDIKSDSGQSGDEIFGDNSNHCELKLPSLVEQFLPDAPPGSSTDVSERLDDISSFGLTDGGSGFKKISADTDSSGMVPVKRLREDEATDCKDSTSPPKKRLKEALPVLGEEKKDVDASVPKSKKELQEEERLKMQLVDFITLLLRSCMPK